MKYKNHISKFHEYCLTKPGVTEGFPFDETILVFKVMNKMSVRGNTAGLAQA